MQRQNVIIIDTPSNDRECWGNLKKACDVHDWKYNTLSKKELPFEIEGFIIRRVPFK